MAEGGDRVEPSVSMSPSGVFAIAWQDDADGDGTYRIHAATWTSDGTAWRDETTINRDATGEQSVPAVAVTDAGGIVVAWTDDMDGNGVGQILAAGFDAP